MDRGTWRTTVHGLQRVRHDLVTKQQQQLLSNTLWKFPSFMKYPLINPLQQIHHFGCWPQEDSNDEEVELLWG